MNWPRTARGNTVTESSRRALTADYHRLYPSAAASRTTSRSLGVSSREYDAECHETVSYSHHQIVGKRTIDPFP